MFPIPSPSAIAALVPLCPKGFLKGREMKDLKDYIIEVPDWIIGDLDRCVIDRKDYDKWKAQSERMNELLRGAVRGQGFQITKEQLENMINPTLEAGDWNFGTGSDPRDTHTGWLIGIEPIEESDSKDKLIKELASGEWGLFKMQEFIDRAKKLLEEK